jgi:predicted PurR-regulated permease PerM
MDTAPRRLSEFEQRVSSRLLDVFIRAALLGAVAVLCYQIFSPFLALMIWSVILAVALYPLHQWLAHRVGGRQALASIVLVTVGVLLIIAPTALLLNSLGDSVRGFVGAVQDNTFEIPAPREGVEQWPVVGKQLYDVWSNAHTDLRGFVASMQPKLGELAARAVGVVASIGSGLLLLVASFVIAGIVMAYGEAGTRGSRAIFERVAGPVRGAVLARLSTATIRAVAQGVIGVAFIQAIFIGLALLLADVRAAGVLSIVALVLGIAQVPALVVTLPVVAYIWWSGDYGNAAAIVHTIVLLLAGMADNVLKPLMLGRGVDAPMPVILLGALGGMASHGIPGMFVGATLLALGYELFMTWVANNPDSETVVSPTGDTSSAQEATSQ